MLVSFLAAVLGFILTGTQAVLIYLDGSGLCLNEGCEIVDSLTLIEPIYFNIFGFLFFVLVSFGLNRARKGSDIWKRFVSLLLLAALAGEGVLFSFQLFITEIYCSYCLIVLTIVFLCNLFMGLKQLFKGIVIFSSVVVAMASLNFDTNQEQKKTSLDDGTLARIGAAAPDRQLYLFFSSSCPYCEKVIEAIKENDNCAINFNPLDTIDSFSLPGAIMTEAYSPETNRAYLENLDIREVPVFLEKRSDSLRVLHGASAIKQYLQLNCSPTHVGQQYIPQTYLPDQTSSSTAAAVLPGADGCVTSEVCEDPQIKTTLPQ